MIEFAALVLLASGVMLGVAPALRLVAHRFENADQRKRPRRRVAAAARSRIMAAMTVAEVALALMLVAGAGWLVQSFSQLRHTDPGFAPTGG